MSGSSSAPTMPDAVRARYRLSRSDRLRLEAVRDHLAEDDVSAALTSVARTEEATARTLGLLLVAERLRSEGHANGYSSLVVRVAATLCREPPSLVVDGADDPELLVAEISRVLLRLGGAGRARAIIARVRAGVSALTGGDCEMSNWVRHRLDAVEAEIDRAVRAGCRRPLAAPTDHRHGQNTGLAL